MHPAGFETFVDLSTSICAVLLAEACNIGLELVRSDVPALTKGRPHGCSRTYTHRNPDTGKYQTGRRTSSHAISATLGVEVRSLQLMATPYGASADSERSAV